MTDMMTGTAAFVKQRDGNGDGRVYRLDPPMLTDRGETEYVWISSIALTLAEIALVETYIFASDADGEVTDWGELPGSFQGAPCDGLPHEQALASAGYRVQS